MPTRNRRGLTFKMKLIFLCSTLILISVISASLFSYIQYKENIKNTTFHNATETSEQLSINVNRYAEEMIRTSMLPYYNSELLTMIQRHQLSEQEQLLQTRYVNNFLEDTLISPQADVLRVFIITDRVYLGTRKYESLDPTIDFTQLSWYRTAITNKKPFFLSDNTESLIKSDKAKVFSLIRPIFGGSSGSEMIGLIKVDATYDGIFNILNKVNNGKQGGVVLSDESGNILYSSLDIDINNSNTFDSFNTAEQTGEIQINHEKYLMSKFPIHTSGWSILSLHSLDELNQHAVDMRNKTLYFAFGCAILMLLIVILSIQNFLNPLFNIVSLMRQVKRGNLDVRFPEQRSDEIGYLGNSFNSMVSQISRIISDNTQLVKQIYEIKLLEQEAKLNALTRQIRPHFIYNTLNMISIMIQSDQSDEAVESIEKLSSMIRKISKMDNNVQLSHEISLINEYLFIQQSRYSEKLRYEIDIQPELYTYSIPSLLLQPLVENAIVHGCEHQDSIMTITICSKITPDAIQLFVNDNGPGIPEHSLALLINLLNNEEFERDNQYTNGIGLLNVHQRIRKQFGQPYGLEIISEYSQGTSIKINLPHEKS